MIIGCTDLLQNVLGGNSFKHILFGRLLHFAANQQFVQYKVGLFEIENNIQFTDLWIERYLNCLLNNNKIRQYITHASKIFVQQLNVSVNDLERQQFVVVLFDGTAKVQTRVSLPENKTNRQKHNSIQTKNHTIFSYLLYTILQSFHSRNEHIFGFLARMVVISSRVIFFFTLSGCATYHFCSRNLPCRLNNSINSI